ncbi:PRC-barrel domain-containing protein [uncultured Jatrophihabitans sp.]|uniref:PRC-barrel domain-containing protein n=1 Tax=uncultured Jatrophihabitans sp. TaxID=1610747 RepID=UPI0035CAAE7F
MISFSDADGMKVVSTSTAETVGKVHGFIVDVRGPNVIALQLKKTDSGDILRWSDVAAFGADAITVADASKIGEGGDDLAPLLDKRNHVLKKRVLTTGGDELGDVKDVEFDPATGGITSLHVGDRSVPGSTLIGIGHYAVVVRTS